MKRSFFSEKHAGVLIDLAIAIAVVAFLVAGLYQTSARALQLFSVGIRASEPANPATSQAAPLALSRELARN